MLASGPDPPAFPPNYPSCRPGSPGSSHPAPFVSGPDPPWLQPHFTGKVPPFNGIIPDRCGVRTAPIPLTQKRNNRTVGRRQLMCCSRWGASRTVLALALLLGLVLIVPSHASAQAVTGTLLGNVTDRAAPPFPARPSPRRETPDQRQPHRRRPTRPATTSSRACRTAPTPSTPSCRDSRRSPVQGVKVDVNTTVRVDLSSRSDR